MTTDQIIDEILDREGEGDPAEGYLDPGDRGGRTTWGISERAHPEAWRDGPPSKAQARTIYAREYVWPWSWVAYEPLRVQLVDIGVNSGLPRAARLLQETLGVEADGAIGPHTRAAYMRACEVADPRHVCNALVAFRLRFIDRLSDAEREQKRFEEGWENRALVFLV